MIKAICKTEEKSEGTEQKAPLFSCVAQYWKSIIFNTEASFAELASNLWTEGG